MPGNTTAYSFRNIQMIIDGRGVEGFWEGDDAISIARNSDNIAPLIGADGDATVSISADDSVTITVRLQPNSIANEILQQKFLQNRNGRTAPFPVSVRDTGSGEGGSAPYCIVQTRPATNFGATASVREWTIFANRWNELKINYEDF